MLPFTPGSWTCYPQTHRGGGHCRWHVTQVAGGVSPSASPWTCTAAGVTAGGSVSFLYIFFFFTLCHPTRRLRQHSPSFLLAILHSFLMVMYQRCSTFYRCVVCLMFVRTKPNTNPIQTDIKLVYEPHLYYSTLNVYYLLFLNLKSFQLHGTVPFSLQNYRAG